jgi:hypothetical protein
VTTEGFTAKLEVLVGGIPEPVVTWFKDNIPIKENDSLKLERKASLYTLSIIAATETDSGDYKVVAKNIAGEAITSATLDVNGKCTIKKLQRPMMMSTSFSENSLIFTSASDIRKRSC